MLGEPVTDPVLDPILLALGDLLEKGDWEEVGLTRLLAVPPSFVRVAEGVPVPAGEAVGRGGEGVAVPEVAALAVERGPEGVLETLGLEVALGESETVLLEQLEAALLRVPAPAVRVGAGEAEPKLVALSRVEAVVLGEARAVALSLGVREAVELAEAEGTREGVDAGVDVPPKASVALTRLLGDTVGLRVTAAGERVLARDPEGTTEALALEEAEAALETEGPVEALEVRVARGVGVPAPGGLAVALPGHKLPVGEMLEVKEAVAHAEGEALPVPPPMDADTLTVGVGVSTCPVAVTVGEVFPPGEAVGCVDTVGVKVLFHPVMEAVGEMDWLGRGLPEALTLAVGRCVSAAVPLPSTLALSDTEPPPENEVRALMLAVLVAQREAGGLRDTEAEGFPVLEKEALLLTPRVELTRPVRDTEGVAPWGKEGVDSCVAEAREVVEGEAVARAVGVPFSAPPEPGEGVAVPLPLALWLPDTVTVTESVAALVREREALGVAETVMRPELLPLEDTRVLPVALGSEVTVGESVPARAPPLPPALTLAHSVGLRVTEVVRVALGAREAVTVTV